MLVGVITAVALWLMAYQHSLAVPALLLVVGDISAATVNAHGRGLANWAFPPRPRDGASLRGRAQHLAHAGSSHGGVGASVDRGVLARFGGGARAGPGVLFTPACRLPHPPCCTSRPISSPRGDQAARLGFVRATAPYRLHIMTR